MTVSTTGGELVTDGVWTHRGKMRVGVFEGALRTKAGPPVDTDFVTVVDGLMVLDTTNLRLYVRSGGLWKSVVVA